MVCLLNVLCPTSQDCSRFSQQCIVAGEQPVAGHHTTEDNLPLDMFVRHVQDSGYEEGDILHPARHNALHWMGKPISYDVNEDLADPF